MRVIGHGGDTDGQCTEFVVVPAQRFAFVLLTANDGGGTVAAPAALDAVLALLAGLATSAANEVRATCLGYRKARTEVHYTPTGQCVLDEKGEECTSLCTVVRGVAVQVTDGDQIFGSAGAICIWCLLNQNEHTGESEGQFSVFPLLDSSETFSWSLYEGSAAAVEWRATTKSNGYATPEQINGGAP